MLHHGLESFPLYSVLLLKLRNDLELRKDQARWEPGWNKDEIIKEDIQTMHRGFLIARAIPVSIT